MDSLAAWGGFIHLTDWGIWMPAEIFLSNGAAAAGGQRLPFTPHLPRRRPRGLQCRSAPTELRCPFVRFSGAGLALLPQAFVVEQRGGLPPGRHPPTMRGCFAHSRSHRQLRQRRCWGCPGMRVWTCALHLEAKAVSWQLPLQEAGAAGEQQICPCPCRDPEKQPGRMGVQRSGGK